MPLKEYVDSRFSTPEEILRFKSVQWVIGYVLGMAGEVGSAVGTLVTLLFWEIGNPKAEPAKKKKRGVPSGGHISFQGVW